MSASRERGVLGTAFEPFGFGADISSKWSRCGWKSRARGVLQPAATDSESYILTVSGGRAVDKRQLDPTGERQFEVQSLPRDVVHGNFIIM